MTPIRILVADDHNLVRAGILRLLNEVADFEVVADTANGAEAIDLACRLQPDVALLDIAMPGITGLQALEKIVSTNPAIRVIILTMYDTEEHVISAMRLGASGFVLKNAAPQEMELAIRAVLIILFGVAGVGALLLASALYDGADSWIVALVAALGIGLPVLLCGLTLRLYARLVLAPGCAAFRSWGSSSFQRSPSRS